MQAPTGKQIRAGRVLLEWDAPYLASLVGIRRESILSIENGLTHPRPSTAQTIVNVFNKHGIEFTDNQGVRFIPEGVEALNGSDGLAAFFDHVYEHLNIHGGLVCVSGVDEAQFAAHHGEEHASAHLKRMKKLVEQRNDIDFRVLLREDDTNFLATMYCHYRWQSKESFLPTPFYVFGDNLALITFQAKPAPKIMVIRSGAFANAYRKQFDIAWKVAQEPPTTDNKK